LIAVLALVVAGCGSSGGGDTSASASTSASTDGDAGGDSGEASQGGGPGGFEISEEARACLDEQGVELPEAPAGGEMPEGGPPAGGGMPEGEPPSAGQMPEGGGAGFGGEQSEEMQEAFEECGVEVPTGGPGQGGGMPNTDSASFRNSVKQYVACVRENGYELPQPDLSGEGPIFDQSAVDQEDPEFKKASEQCQDLLGGTQGGNDSGTAEAG
jgi:hypothetical protein